MGDEITIRVDARLGYALIAILAVIGIFAVGWWLGTQLTKPPTAPQANVNAPGPGAAAPQAPQTGLGAATPGSAPVEAIAKGVSPVSVDDLPVAEGQPRIWIDELTKDSGFVYDLGRIDAYAVTEQTFTIRNLGTADLVIEKVNATCGCTAAVLESSKIPPGATTTIRVAYDPNVNQEQGKFIQKQIQIKSNDPVAPVIEFAIEADVASQ